MRLISVQALTNSTHTSTETNAKRSLAYLIAKGYLAEYIW